MSEAHTKGPWEATSDPQKPMRFLIKPSTFGQQGRTFGYKPLAVVELDKRMVAKGSAEANARLIASAPCLLDAIKLARNELHACQAVIHLRGGFDPAYVSDAQAAIKVLDAAITKATKPVSAGELP